MPRVSTRNSFKKKAIYFQEKKVTLDVLSHIHAITPTVETNEYKSCKTKCLAAEKIVPFSMCGLRFIETQPGQRRPALSAPVCISPSGHVGVLTSRISAKFDPRLSRERITSQIQPLGLRLGRELTFAKNLFDIRVPASQDIFDTANQLRRLKCCKYATPEILHESRRYFSPTDPRFSEQWQWPKIGLPAAWDHSKGANIRIAIIDWGFDLDHRDIASAVDYTAFFRENGVQQKASYFSDPGLVPRESHGTICAGMAIARQGNNRFGCGAAFEASFVPIACSPVMTQQTLGRALAFAADPTTEDSTITPAKRADVISLSISPPIDALSPLLSDAFDFVRTKGRSGLGVPIFYAISNIEEALENDPIGSDPRVLAIGRTNRHDLRAECAFGANLRLMAPGDNIRSTMIGDDFGTASGTSFATPCAAGVAALVLSVRPNLSLRKLIELLQACCDKVGPAPYDASGRNEKYGFGRINAEKAVANATK